MVYAAPVSTSASKEVVRWPSMSEIRNGQVKVPISLTPVSRVHAILYSLGRVYLVQRLGGLLAAALLGVGERFVVQAQGDVPAHPVGEPRAGYGDRDAGVR